jgi:hypothetical protein
MRRWILWLVFWGCLFGLAPGLGLAQAPGEFRLTALMGPAFLTNAPARPFNLGMSVDASLFRVGRGRAGGGLLVEGGIYHPSISGSGNYYFSADTIVGRGQALPVAAAMRLRLFAVSGYTRIFNASSTATDTANAVNFGVGVDRALGEDVGVRLEVRELYTPAGDSHVLAFRIGLVAIGPLE